MKLSRTSLSTALLAVFAGSLVLAAGPARADDASTAEDVINVTDDLDNTGSVLAPATLNVLAGTITGGTVGSAETNATVYEGAAITDAAGAFGTLTNAGTVSFTDLSAYRLVNSSEVTTSGSPRSRR
ncbi:hypothetical protein [Sutterella sp.]|uniref:hypothetical protein n=1 Tax=Sutterella sp. TaxID=1981025 RepID=UPI0026DF4978|nr:hypothetical protein [Sutterella sp.]MDO5532981.1 hypothetical protein [Sutterella sp.]